MILSIVIVNWNTRDYLLAALESLELHAPGCEHELLVVDNASGDASVSAVEERFPRVRVIANGHNLGYARGNNQGAATARGRYLLLLNPDVVIPEGVLDRALAIMDEEADIGALGARLVHPDGRVQQSVRGFPAPLAVACEALGLSRLFPRSRVLASYRMPWFDYQKRSDVDQPMGTFLMIRREAWDRVGPFDERFPIFFNEVDWCLRARQAGFRIVYAPEVEIVHYGGASTAQVAPAMAWESRRGLLAFYRKHYRGPVNAPAYWLAAGASWLHAWVTSRRRRVMGR